MNRRLSTWLALAAIVAVIAVGAWLRPGVGGGGSGNDAAIAAAEKTAAAEIAAASPALPELTGPSPTAVAATPTAARSTTPSAPRRDLAADEARGGHTLARHVGQGEAALRERLRREPEISAASSYFDGASAETTVARALAQESKKVASWVKQGNQRPNLVLRTTMPGRIGISLARGASKAVDAKSAVVVLRAIGSDWYVLTSYPEAR